MFRATASVSTLTVALVMVVGGAGGGCLTPSQNRQDTLVRITHEYNNGLRWGRYQDVTPHLAADEAERFMARAGALGDDFEMADDEVSSVEFKDGGTRADVLVDFTWYNQRRALVRKTRVGQDWRFTDGRWVCVAQRRVRGDRFPLIAEGPAPSAAASHAASPPPRE
ncbi:MAG: hypothetical protein ABUL77_01255 [Bacteroidota bacterium]